ncbi:Os05g0137000 [Oryza sativa Japonica Group]|uniref:Os05g0137000 protein n=2 Tax=Oryza sativa subsp. japonica TaxID=39947 RepID=A0A0P0WHM1_ORYSJ|nr:unknown protein [Oryza sativa Japonica Group]KAB8098014.1 hypothetical protein EE612_026953 [Oryza sativa]BAF16496.1 Os05g0137000 [Oryza sativa Japonica Group]BAS92160.1 Os05g0137000 [Oryza sativa Japonica Group]|eukprot:NP_001054582.1 Os05g0137000 [Oryza sativa Japonica Group]
MKNTIDHGELVAASEIASQVVARRGALTDERRGGRGDGEVDELERHLGDARHDVAARGAAEGVDEAAEQHGHERQRGAVRHRAQRPEQHQRRVRAVREREQPVERHAPPATILPRRSSHRLAAAAAAGRRRRRIHSERPARLRHALQTQDSQHQTTIHHPLQRTQKSTSKPRFLIDLHHQCLSKKAPINQRTTRWINQEMS